MQENLQFNNFKNLLIVADFLCEFLFYIKGEIEKLFYNKNICLQNKGFNDKMTLVVIWN